MPITYALNMFGLSFATLSSLLVWVILEHRHAMGDAARRVPKLVIESLPGRSKAQEQDETGAPDVPIWWYLVGCAPALFMSIFAVEYWDAELRWQGVLLAVPLRSSSTPRMSFFNEGHQRRFFSNHIPPFPLVSNRLRNIELPQDKLISSAESSQGLCWRGKVLTNIWFFDLRYITTIKALYLRRT